MLYVIAVTSAKMDPGGLDLCFVRYLRDRVEIRLQPSGCVATYFFEVQPLWGCNLRVRRSTPRVSSLEMATALSAVAAKCA